MNGEVGNGNNEDDFDDDVESADPTDTIVMSEDPGDISAELNVEELVGTVEVKDASQRQKEIHRRLEELEEQRRTERELDSTFNFNLDDDVT
ncbi:MAG: hypothetical protein GWN47_09275 [Woeseiaceae bacterium]|nr:hypothetical protein [Woeseiaceae bacterium]